MFEKLEDLGIILNDKQKELYISFCKDFLKYNQKVNLISKNDEKYLYEKHIYDSLAINLFLKNHGNINKLMDIGAGGGFPSLPAAILYPDIEITAVDSIGKKIKFISETAQNLGLKNIEAKTVRVEDLPPSFKESYDVVTSRAMAQLSQILEYAMPFVKIGGYFIAYKALKADEELKQAQNALKILRAEFIEKIKYTLPLEEQQDRVLLVFKKCGKTPELYPRKNGIISKKPL